MPSDPTTKDLIAARAQFSRHSSTCSAHASGMCQRCLLHALANRLEEVEEERDRLNEGYIRATTALRSFTRTTRRDADWAKAVLEDIEKHTDPGSPEPSDPDPDTDDVPTRAESVDPEPDDDPWEAVEKRLDGRSVLRPFAEALRDLRERVGKLDRWGHEMARHLGSQAAEIEERLDALEEVAHEPVAIPIGNIQARLAKLEAFFRDPHGEATKDLEIDVQAVLPSLIARLATLEGHAERGSEAERELWERSEHQDADISHLRQRVSALEATLRGDRRPHIPGVFVPPIGENT